ncbi:MAG: hypothetical protein QW503_03325 [Sulfolobales archaeon]
MRTLRLYAGRKWIYEKSSSGVDLHGYLFKRSSERIEYRICIIREGLIETSEEKVLIEATVR